MWECTRRGRGRKREEGEEKAGGPGASWGLLCGREAGCPRHQATLSVHFCTTTKLINGGPLTLRLSESVAIPLYSVIRAYMPREVERGAT